MVVETEGPRNRKSIIEKKGRKENRNEKKQNKTQEWKKGSIKPDKKEKTDLVTRKLNFRAE